jgi:hypothetical protein
VKIAAARVSSTFYATRPRTRSRNVAIDRCETVSESSSGPTAMTGTRGPNSDYISGDSATFR